MGREGAVALLDHIDDQWREPMTFDERQEWGKLLVGLDMDYAVAAFTAAKIASPVSRPSPDIYEAIYGGVVDAAHAAEEDPEPEPEQEEMPVVGNRDAKLSEIQRIRQETGLVPGSYDGPARLNPRS